jgi:energy-converting hydrogenase Eha subunit C
MKLWNKGSQEYFLKFDTPAVNYQVSPGSFIEIEDKYEDKANEYCELFSDLSLDQTGGDIKQSQICAKSVNCKMYGPIINRDSTLLLARVTTDAATNTILTGDGKLLYTKNIGEQTLGPVAVASGLDIGADQTSGDGIELNVALGDAVNAINQFSNLTDSQFYAKIATKIEDISGVAQSIVAFRKTEAHQADYNNYNDLAGVNAKGADLHVSLINNNAATVETDTAVNLTDDTKYDFLVVKDDVKALEVGIDLANGIKSLYNAHLADALAHTTAIDDVNTVTTADASDLTTLLALTNALTTSYALHDDDAELASGWAFHAAQEASDYSLAAVTTVTTLVGALSRLNDMKTKMNSHIADVTAHGAASTAISADLASNYFCFYKLATASAYTNISVAGTLLDTVATVISTYRYTHATDLAGVVALCEYEQDYGLPLGFSH